MAKRKLDEVEYVDDGISDDFVNEIGEVFEKRCDRLANGSIWS